MTIFRIYVFTIITLITSKVLGQEEFCECSLHSTLKYKSEYKDFIPNNILTTNKIKEVVIYAEYQKNTAKDQGLESNTHYIRAKLKFNDQGNLISRIEYSSGKPSYLYEYKRNQEGLIVQEVYSYLNNNSRKSDFFPGDIKDYYYDNNNLIKIKRRNYLDEIIPDEKSDYEKFTYNSSDQLTKEISHTYFTANSSSIYLKEYELSENNLATTYTTKFNNEIFGTGKKTYDEKGKLIRETFQGTGESPSDIVSIFEYNANNNIIKMQRISKGNNFDECPEDGNFINAYEYDSNGYIKTIIHTYQDVECKLVFEFRN